MQEKLKRMEVEPGLWLVAPLETELAYDGTGESGQRGDDVCLDWDFVKLAEAMHCAGLRCKTRKDLKEKMTEFLECDKPIVVSC